MQITAEIMSTYDLENFAIHVTRYNGSIPLDFQINSAMTSKSRGYKLVILFVDFLLQDSCLVHQVIILINPESKTEEVIIMVCEH